MSVASPNLTTLNPPLGRCTFNVDLSRSVGRLSGLGTGTRSAALFRSVRRPRGVGGADHSQRGGTGDDHSTLVGGGEDQSPRVGGPAPVPWDAIRRAGRKLEREGLSVRKLSEASSDLKIGERN